jgi:hypothetical protein
MAVRCAGAAKHRSPIFVDHGQQQLDDGVFTVLGFVYERARLRRDANTVEIEVRPRRGSKLRCSGCLRAAPGYDRLAARRFEFIPLWGFAVALLYAMRRGNCRRRGVKVAAVPWAVGKHGLTQVPMTNVDLLAEP